MRKVGITKLYLRGGEIIPWSMCYQILPKGNIKNVGHFPWKICGMDGIWKHFSE